MYEKTLKEFIASAKPDINSCFRKKY